MSTTDLLALCRVRGVSWHYIARQAQRPDGIASLTSGRPLERNTDAEDTARLLADARDELPRHRDWVAMTLEAVAAEGVHLTTILDDNYPANLRLIYNPPPFLFYRGELHAADARAVAVVGTRAPTDDGLQRASRLAHALAEAGVTVVSGLARGIDTAAHTACLDAGGRTIAVIGTGIRLTYPPENAALAERIAATGAVVSQFWPDGPPTQATFPRRNVVMSGIGQGTVVVEASATSGAKMQARYALEQGKRLFLLSSLVEERLWARGYVKRGAVEVRRVEDIIELLRSPEAILAQSEQRRQLSLALS